MQTLGASVMWKLQPRVTLAVVRDRCVLEVAWQEEVVASVSQAASSGLQGTMRRCLSLKLAASACGGDLDECVERHAFPALLGVP